MASMLTNMSSEDKNMDSLGMTYIVLCPSVTQCTLIPQKFHYTSNKNSDSL